MRKLGALGIVSALVGGLMFVGVSSASAHTPSVSATCDGVTVSGSGYESGDTNQLSVSVSGGGSDSNTFATSGSATASVPQDGVSHSYTASVQTSNGDPSFSKSYSGTVGPCGTPTKPADAVEQRDVKGDPNCTTFTVTTQHQSRMVPTVLVNNVWVPGTPTEWVTNSSSDSAPTAEECPPPTKPADAVEERDVKGDPNCTTFTVTTQHQSRMVPTVLINNVWVPGTPTEWVTNSSSDSVGTMEECPPPSQPEPIVSETQSAGQSCGDDFVTTTMETTTLAYVLDQATRTWVLGEPTVVSTSVDTPVTAVACDTEVIVDDPDGNPDGGPVVGGERLLPDTGGTSLGIGVAGLVLMLGGLFVLGSQRHTVAVDGGAEPTVDRGLESNLEVLVRRRLVDVSPRQWSAWVTKRNLQRRLQRRTGADE